MLLYLAGQCAFLRTRSPPWISGTRRGFSRVPTIPDPSPLTVFRSGRDPQVQSSSPQKAFFCLSFGDIRARRRPRQKLLCFLGVAGGTIERSCYSPHYVNTERDYERDYQATLPQGRTAAGGCKPRHGRGDRKRERSFSGLRDTKCIEPLESARDWLLPEPGARPTARSHSPC